MNENENKYTELVEFTNILFHKFHEVQGAKLRDTFGRILQELREDTNADPLAKFVVYNRLYELAIDKTNFELVKVLTEELTLLQTELQRIPPTNKHLQEQIKNLLIFTISIYTDTVTFFTEGSHEHCSLKHLPIPHPHHPNEYALLSLLLTKTQVLHSVYDQHSQ